MNKQNLLVWIDLEMTGLNPQKDLILELAMILTDAQLNLVGESFSAVIHYPQHELQGMSDFVKKLHTTSGLLDAVAQSKTTLTQVQNAVMEILRAYCIPEKSLLCGNSIWQDRAFLAVHMPEVLKYLHYRILDVSSIKEVIRRWYPDQKTEFKKSDKHRALADIQESVAELSFYRQNFFK